MLSGDVIIFSSAVPEKPTFALHLPICPLQRLYKQVPETGRVIFGRLAEMISDRLRGNQAQVVKMLISRMEYNEINGNRRGANGR
jgi:hypothetical protein